MKQNNAVEMQSELRKNLFVWYDFRKESSLLAIGADCPPLTALFQERCRAVDCIAEGYPDTPYDYIVLTGTLETIPPARRAEYLTGLKACLNPGGTLLIAVNNRYGLKYFCGEQEAHTGRAFEGLRGYPGGTPAGQALSKQELSGLLETSGFAFKFYYPLSDYTFTQAVYTDAYLPSQSVVERLMPYYRDKSTLIADEKQLYRDIIDHGVFPFFANSFLVECRETAPFSPVIFAAVSADRSRRDACATIIYDDGTVRKVPLYEEGKESIAAQEKTLQELERHGVKTVPHAVQNHALVMPYMTGPKLSDELRGLAQTDRDGYLGLFDRLYQIIAASSEHTGRNALANPETAHLDWGPVLKRASLELIPLNCFVQDGAFYFFDQEFVREEYPAKFILFRAIKYTYLHAPEIQDYLPREALVSRFGLSGLWRIFEAAERDFQRQVRCHDAFGDFRRHVHADHAAIERNIDRLMSGGASLYKPDAAMLHMRRIQLDLLEQFDKVCREHGLPYYLIRGTLLGAVRHSGFIPWDDDIDVAMHRADFDRLKAMAPGVFAEPYFFQTAENDPACFHGGMARLRNSNTTGMSAMDIGHDCHQGIWMDILVLDSCPAQPEAQKQKRRAVKKAARMLFAKVYGGDMEEFPGMDEELWEEYGALASERPHAELCQALDTAYRLYHDDQSEYLAVFTVKRPQMYLRSDFERTVQLPFEGRQFLAPAGYKRALQMSKGKDYMAFPPVHEQVPHHDGIFIPDLPYREFGAKFNHLLDGAEDKTIVIFGAGIMAEDYLRRYGRTHPPAFLVDNDTAKWGTEKFGFPVKSPEALRDITDLHLIICSVYYREIEAQLEQMGMTQIKVYTKEKGCIAKEEGRRMR